MFIIKIEIESRLQCIDTNYDDFMFRSFYPGWKYLGLYCIPGVLVTIAGINKSSSFYAAFITLFNLKGFTIYNDI